MTVKDILKITTCDVYIHELNGVHKFTGNWNNPLYDREVKKMEPWHQRGTGKDIITVYLD